MTTKNNTQKRKKKNSTTSEKPTWDLTQLYSSANDTAIEKDIAYFEGRVLSFVKKYSVWSKQYADPTLLKTALADYEKLSSAPEASRAGYYFGLRRELNAADDEAEKRLNLLSDRLTKSANKLLFFDLAIGKIPSPVQKRLLRDDILKKWHYYLKNIFEDAKHHLTEAEEKIMSLKGTTSHGLWVAGTEKMLHRRTLPWKGKKLPLSEAFDLVAKLQKTDRRKLWSLAMKECMTLGEVAENELTAIVLDKKVNDELRAFPKPYSGTLRSNENSEASIEALLQAVKDNFSISHRFYRLKAKMLKEKKLLYADRSASVGTESGISFDSATSTLREVFHNVNPTYAQILDKMLDDRQIDVTPKKGKTSGAFCASIENLPTFVLLNFIPGTRSLMTYAHEMGHAIHAERAKAVQPPIYQGHSTAVAETASTLFENLVFDANVATLNRKERIVALHDKIQDDISSIMRQTAFFEYERDMHETIRKNGALNHDELATMMQKHLKSYLGPAVEVTKEDGYTFVYVSHFRRFFYVYTYVYGNIVSNALAERLRNDKGYTKEIDQFLTAGCSKSPEAIFGDIGIDVSKPSFFAEGLKKLDARITELEQLVAQK